MKRLICVALAMSALSGPALAESYFGVRVGYPEVGVHFGSWTALSSLIGLRVSAGYGAVAGGGFNIEGDVTYRLTTETPTLAVYLGGGLNLDVGQSGTGTTVSPGLAILAGLEYAFQPNLSVFIEANPAFYFVGQFYPAASAGLNFRF